MFIKNIKKNEKIKQQQQPENKYFYRSPIKLFPVFLSLTES